VAVMEQVTKGWLLFVKCIGGAMVVAGRTASFLMGCLIDL